MSNLNLKYRKKYGMFWPVEVHDIQVDLALAKKWREDPYKGCSPLEPGEHLLRAIRALFTKDEWCISPWTEEHAHAWTLEESLFILGCAASSKSNDIGGFCVCDWISDPLDTITIMASTSKQALADRSYESVLRYFQILKANPHFSVPGVINKTSMAIVNADDEYGKLTTNKAAIRGVAVQEGTADEARANLQGRHMAYVRLCLDELSQMRPAAMDARINLRIGARKDFKLVGLANPDSLFDLAGRFTEPDPGGWASVDENTPRWRSKHGLVIHHNGFHSPAVTEPDGAKKYPYLINKAQIDATIADCHGNEDAKDVWTMVRGFAMKSGVESTILTETDVTAFNMTMHPVWDDRAGTLIRVAGLDPAFTSGGDGCVFQPAEIGLVREGALVCAFMDPEYFPIKESAARPATYQVVDQLIERCAELGISIESVAIDDSGTQSVADVVVVESGIHPIRCNFGAGASEFPLSSTNLKPAKERYRNLGTEMWALLAEFGRFGQLRNFPAMAARQFCLRKFKPGAGLKILESKKEFKKRLPGQRSPDEGDAAALAIWAARQKAGLRAGFSSLADLRVPSKMGNRPLSITGRNFMGTSYKNSFDLSRFSVYSKG